MSAIAFDLPEDVIAVRDGVLRFGESEIVPRVEDNHALFEDQWASSGFPPAAA